MAQVTLRINGFSYVMGCGDGQEDHLLAMGAEVDRRIAAIKASAGQSGEARMLALVALMMADDIYELNKKLEDAQPAPQAEKADPKLGRRLNRMAKRAEEIAEDLEAP